VPDTAVVIVCLPKATPTDQLATTATTRLGSTPLTSAGPARHFPISTRLRRGSLVQPWHDTAAAASGRLADQLSYLDSAQGHLSTLGSRDYLVALATA